MVAQAPKAARCRVPPLAIVGMRHVMERIADHPSNRIDELLPWVVAARRVHDAGLNEMPLAA